MITEDTRLNIEIECTRAVDDFARAHPTRYIAQDIAEMQRICYGVAAKYTSELVLFYINEWYVMPFSRHASVRVECPEPNSVIEL